MKTICCRITSTDLKELFSKKIKISWNCPYTISILFIILQPRGLLYSICRFISAGMCGFYSKFHVCCISCMYNIHVSIMDVFHLVFLACCTGPALYIYVHKRHLGQCTTVMCSFFSLHCWLVFETKGVYRTFNTLDEDLHEVRQQVDTREDR